MRGNAQHKTVWRGIPGFHHACIRRLLGFSRLRYKVSGHRVYHVNFALIYGVDSLEFYVIVIRDFRYFAIEWLGYTCPVD